MEIKEMLLTPNAYSRRRVPMEKVREIIIHYVGNPKSTAVANRNYFESLKTGKKYANGKFIYASSTYIVGLQGEIIRCVPENEESIHAGNNYVNRNSIGVEICHPDWTGKITDVTLDASADLCADICIRYNLNPFINIRRHYDVTGKDCPRWFVSHPYAFVEFKELVLKKIEAMKKSMEIERIVKGLVAKKYVNSPAYWDNVMKNEVVADYRWVKELLANISGQTDTRAIIRWLAERKVVTSLDYWQKVIEGKQKMNVEWFIILLGRLVNI